MRYNIITIEREYASGGREIGLPGQKAWDTMLWKRNSGMGGGAARHYS